MHDTRYAEEPDQKREAKTPSLKIVAKQFSNKLREDVENGIRFVYAKKWKCK